LPAERAHLGFRRVNCYIGRFTPSGHHSIHEPGGEMKEERAAIQFAEQLTAWPAAIQPDDLESLGKFFNIEQIEELVLAIATANLTNRFNEGMKTPVDV
jgi:alkylhydroperoxidase family enzyme